jgi:5'-nucleotidase
MWNRRAFIKQSLIGSGLLLAQQFPFRALAAASTQKLTILHTNDIHSRLEPFPMDGSKLQGLGGIEARAALIAQIRQAEEQVLLLDAGDIFQGTPYFNIYKGEPEIKAMSLMGYDAATMGNHDFDAGLEGFAQQLPHANFPFLTANYDFKKTILAGKTQDYTIIKKGNLKVGIFGLGIQLYGLVPASAYGKTYYKDPIKTAQDISYLLKHKKGCDIVICLSHLGFQYSSNKVSDIVLAEKTSHIDIIIGGHTHTFLEEAVKVNNLEGKAVIINQVGWGGTRLGRIDLYFDHKKNYILSKGETVIPIKQTIG